MENMEKSVPFNDEARTSKCSEDIASKDVVEIVDPSNPMVHRLIRRIRVFLGPDRYFRTVGRNNADGDYKAVPTGTQRNNEQKGNNIILRTVVE